MKLAAAFITGIAVHRVLSRRVTWDEFEEGIWAWGISFIHDEDDLLVVEVDLGGHVLGITLA